MITMTNKFEELEKQLESYEDLIDFVEWYANKRGLTSFIDEFNNEVESDLYEQICRLKMKWEDELNKPTRNYYKYSIQKEIEERNQRENFREMVM